MLTDGSEDASITEKEAVFVQYLDRKPPGQDTVKVTTAFLRLVKLKFGNAPGIVNAIKNSFEAINITDDFNKKLIGFAANGATKYKSCNGNHRRRQHHLSKYIEAKTEFQRFYTQEAATSVLKTKIQYTKAGEKSKRYFYSLERQKQSKQTINVLTKVNLDTITAPHHTTSLPNPKTTRNHFILPNQPILNDETLTLTAHDRNPWEGSVTEHKLQLALQNRENNKSPGLEALSTNFFKHFWPLLGPKLTNIYNYAYDHGHLSLSRQHGVISPF